MRVDFYVLPSEEAGAPRVWVGRLIEKAYRAGCRVHVRAQDAQHARQLDDALWTFRAGSFVPHVYLADAPADALTPVTVGSDETPPSNATVLVNLADSIPTWHAQFERIAELVPFDPNMRQLSRVHFGEYKRLGYSIETHQLA